MTVPGPIDPSTLNRLCSNNSVFREDRERTGVSLKGSRWNWEETVPGEEKVNKLFKTNYNK